MAIANGPNLSLLVNANLGEEHYAALTKFLRGVDGLVQPRVLDKDLAAPPGSPVDGDMYIVAAGATGLWSTHSGKLARWSTVQAAWEFFVPKAGWRAYVNDEAKNYQYSGSVWAEVTSSSSGDVVGPASAVADRFATFNGTTGKIIKDSGLSLTTSTTLAGNSNTNIPSEAAVKTYVDAQKSVVVNSQSAAYTLSLTDANTMIYHPPSDATARTWTIPANSSVAFPVGTTITFDNDFGGGTITINITTDTLVLVGTSGTVGSRTLASGGQATAVKVSTTRWRIIGTGLT